VVVLDARADHPAEVRLAEGDDAVEALRLAARSAPQRRSG
jgi:hypothetical protein